MLRRFNPFGPGNQKPIFCTRGVLDFGTSKLVGKRQEHLKLELVDDTAGKVFNTSIRASRSTSATPSRKTSIRVPDKCSFSSRSCT